MKLFIHVNSFEKVICEIVAFLFRGGGGGGGGGGS